MVTSHTSERQPTATLTACEKMTLFMTPSKIIQIRSQITDYNMLILGPNKETTLSRIYSKFQTKDEKFDILYPLLY